MNRGISRIAIVSILAVALIGAGGYSTLQNNKELPDNKDVTNPEVNPKEDAQDAQDIQVKDLKKDEQPVQKEDPAFFKGSVEDALRNRLTLKNQTIVIEDIISFDYLCTSVEGGERNCETQVFLGPLSGNKIYIKEGGEYLSCSQIQNECGGFVKDGKYSVEGVFSVPEGSEEYLGSYYIDVKYKKSI